MKRIFLILVFVFTAQADGIDLTSACVAQYNLNDNADNNAVVDSRGFSNGTAQQNTSALHTTGKIGGALSFNGESDYIDTGNTFNDVVQHSFSINLWVKVLSTPPENKIFFGADHAGTPEDDQVILFFTYSGALRLEYAPDQYGENLAYASAGEIFTDTSWKMITATITIDESEESAQVRIYADGVIKNAGDEVTGIDFSNWAENTLNFFIGASNWGGTDNSHLDGLIDNVMIFNRALSQAEIDFLYNGGAGTETLEEQFPRLDRLKRLNR